MTEDPYQNELVDRCAPRWAWEIIDAALDAQSCGEKGPDSDKTGEAYEAMLRACEYFCKD